MERKKDEIKVKGNSKAGEGEGKKSVDGIREDTDRGKMVEMGQEELLRDGDGKRWREQGEERRSSGTEIEQGGKRWERRGEG